MIFVEKQPNNYKKPLTPQGISGFLLLVAIQTTLFCFSQMVVDAPPSNYISD
ncbi:MAG: hypothetical protein IJ155_11950 [Prevotella sp.]|nr:hypothetical protein [Prevotella sp.]